MRFSPNASVLIVIKLESFFLNTLEFLGIPLWNSNDSSATKLTMLISYANCIRVPFYIQSLEIDFDPYIYTNLMRYISGSVAEIGLLTKSHIIFTTFLAATLQKLAAPLLSFTKIFSTPKTLVIISAASTFAIDTSSCSTTSPTKHLKSSTPTRRKQTWRKWNESTGSQLPERKRQNECCTNGFVWFVQFCLSFFGKILK